MKKKHDIKLSWYLEYAWKHQREAWCRNNAGMSLKYVPFLQIIIDKLMTDFFGICIRSFALTVVTDMGIDTTSTASLWKSAFMAKSIEWIAFPQS